MKKYILMLFAGLMVTSCVDTVILPNDKTVEEDFWKQKSDVQLMVNGAYRAMLSGDVVSRLIVWSGLRSEELIPATTITGSLAEDLTEINLANTQPDNAFATWGAFYTVINDCNLVLDYAARVMEEDPSYTEGDYLADCSQMLALRSLCYFYLVRNFRDVPLITEAMKNSSQNRNIAQASPDSVLNTCLADLEVAARNALLPTAYRDWRRVGYLTRDGIYALMADIYLWRGSVKHSQSDYEEAVRCCNYVIESKRSQHVLGYGEVEIPDYPLTQGRLAFNTLFQTGNSEESVFELQFDARSNTNTGMAQYYSHYNSRDNTQPYLYASDIFKFGDEIYKTGNYVNDWRAQANTYNSSVTAGDLNGRFVRKYVAPSTSTYFPSSPSSSSETKDNSVATFAATAANNFIIYRLTDVMLMKAEALTAQALLLQTQGQGTDENGNPIENPNSQRITELLQEAFPLVEAVNTRSRENDIDVIKYNTYATVDNMEALILAERLRELAFEGKRWYDLLRYHYRHQDQLTDYGKTLAEMADAGEPFHAVYDQMLALSIRKMGSKGSAVAAKISDEARLYLPVGLSDLSISNSLRQNPAYSTLEDFNKNY